MSARHDALRELTGAAVDLLVRWEDMWGPYEPHPASAADIGRLAEAWGEYTQRMDAMIPFFHPRYAGQMIKPPHPVAAAAYHAAMLVNPNNHALDASQATSPMEVEVDRGAGADVRPRAAVARAPDLERDDRQPRGALGRP